jgi:hypothetical protein
LHGGQRRYGDDCAGNGVVVLGKALLDGVAKHDEQDQVKRRQRTKFTPAYNAHDENNEHVQHDRTNGDIHYGNTVTCLLRRTKEMEPSSNSAT